MLSTICGIFDPLGLLTSILVKLRTLFQVTCLRKLDRDQPLPDDIAHDWSNLLKGLPELQKFNVPRVLMAGVSEDYKD